jgi:hypothetical protein
MKHHSCGAHCQEKSRTGITAMPMMLASQASVRATGMPATKMGT